MSFNSKDLVSFIGKSYIKDPRNGIRKLKNQIESLSAVVDLWRSWVDQCLAVQSCELNVVNWVKEQLLPAVYFPASMIVEGTLLLLLTNSYILLD